MTAISSLLQRLTGLGIKLTIVRDKLKITAPDQVVSKELLAEISQNKQQIIAYLSEIHQTGSKDDIKPIAPQQFYPVSHAQRRMWILYQMEEKQTAYNVCGAYAFEGEFNRDAFGYALEKVIRKHEILRTTFITVAGTHYQKINSPETLGFQVEDIDLSHEAQAEQLAMARMHKALQVIFDLEKGPLFTIKLFRVSPQKTLFFLALHHIISDGWSGGLLEKEILHRYQSEVQNIPYKNAPHLIQYKEYAAWQNQRIEQGELDHQRTYWMDRLSGELPVMDLPYYQERPSMQTFAGKIIGFSFSKRFSNEIKHLAKKNETTLFTILMALLYLFFYKKTDRRDLILGTAVAGRNHKDIQNQVGFFVNTLALRLQLKNQLTFGALLKEVKAMVIESFAHDDYPFDKLVEELDVPRDLSRAAVFDVLVEVHQFDQLTVADQEVNNTGGLIMRPLKLREETSIYDLNYIFREEEEKLHLDIRYNTDLFKEEQITAWVDEFEQLTEMAVKNPGHLINDYTLLSDEEIWVGLPYRTGYVPENTSVVKLIEEQAGKFPNRIAVAYENEAITYSELAGKVNEMAAFLVRHRSEVGEVVGIMSERNPVMLQSMLAIWKAGMAYLPIDGEYPVNRMKHICEDAGVRILLAGKRFIREAHFLQWDCPALQHLVCIDSDDLYTEAEPLNESMKQELWEYVGDNAEDDITGGGWLSSYTGLPIPRTEMNEYQENVFLKLEPWLHPEASVLEIGCASGITMFRLAPFVKKYVGTDLSTVILEKNQERIRQEKIHNIELYHLYSHEINQLDEQDFDIIIINSVVQNFNGYNYLRDVIAKCINHMAPQGILFLGDIMDLKTKPALIASLETFKAANHNETHTTKTEWDDELFVPKAYFDDLSFDFTEIVSVKHSGKSIPSKMNLPNFAMTPS